MENTVDAVLQHGDGDPQALIDKLQSGGTPGGADTAMDEAIARQLAQEERRGGGRRAPSSSTTRTQTQPSVAPAPAPAVPKPKGRGTPTDLPPDFLRIPGAPIPATSSSTMDADEALARMLQDELFSQELANNPEFAHLARGRPRTVGGRPVSSRSSRGRVGEMPRRGSAAQYPAGQSHQHEGPNLMDKISGEPRVCRLGLSLTAETYVHLILYCFVLLELGDNAKNRLAAFAAQWNENNRTNRASNQSAMGSRSAAPQETRGLLDVDDDGEEMEMTFAGTAGYGSKKNM